MNYNDTSPRCLDFAVQSLELVSAASSSRLFKLRHGHCGNGVNPRKCLWDGGDSMVLRYRGPQDASLSFHYDLVNLFHWSQEICTGPNHSIARRPAEAVCFACFASAHISTTLKSFRWDVEDSKWCPLGISQSVLSVLYCKILDGRPWVLSLTWTSLTVKWAAMLRRQCLPKRHWMP